MKNLGVRVCARVCGCVAFGGRMLSSLSKGGTEIVQACDSCCQDFALALLLLLFWE